MNKHIFVTAMTFTRGMAATPSRLDYDGQTYYVQPNAPRVAVKSGASATDIVSVSDGHKQFRLSHKQGIWSLLDAQ